MTKLLAFILAGAMLLSFAACGGDDSVSGHPDQSQAQDQQEPDSQGDTPSGDANDDEDAVAVVTVYSPHDTAPLEAGIQMFENAYPDVKVEVVADGTGTLLNRIAAELAAPTADVLWGGGADSLAAYKDFFQPYKPTCIDLLDPDFYDPEYYWIGESPLPMVFLVNTDLVAEADIPRSWADLADSKWKGQIAFADPSSSGSAYTQLCTMLMTYGEENDDYASGWDFVRRVIPNMVIQSGSSAAHKNVDNGTYPIGVTLEKAAVQYDTSDSGHLRIIYPSDGTSAVPDGVAIVKNCPHPEMAQLFVEYVLSAECQAAQNADYGRRPIRSDVSPEGLPALRELPLMNYNFDYAADKKSEIVEAWENSLPS